MEKMRSPTLHVLNKIKQFFIVCPLCRFQASHLRQLIRYRSRRSETLVGIQALFLTGIGDLDRALIS